jgi:hypothetical protein
VSQSQLIRSDKDYVAIGTRITRVENIYDSVLGTPRYGDGGSASWWSKYSDGSNFESAAELNSHKQKDAKEQQTAQAKAKESAARSVGVASPAEAKTLPASATQAQAAPTDPKWEQEEKPQILALISAA